MRKTVKLGLVMLLVSMLLVGCAGNKSASIAGRLVLNVNPSIAVNYLEDGTVDSIEALNEDGKLILEKYTDFKGLSTQQVVAELVQHIGEAGYLVDEIEKENRQITIELDEDSFIPNEKFLNEIAKAVSKFLTDSGFSNDIKLSDDTDYDFSDYLDADYDETDYDTDYDDTDYEVEQPVVKPVPKPPVKPVAPSNDTDYDDTDYDDADYDDSDYDETDYDDSDYDDSDYDDSDYDDSDYN